MLHVSVLLVLGGVVGAVLRQYRKNQIQPALPQLSPSVTVTEPDKWVPKSSVTVFDDVGELNHYQKVAWYALALSAAGYWFYPPIRVVSLPMLGYNSYHFVTTLRHSDKNVQQSPITLFESIGITASLATGSAVTASLLLLFFFGTRRLLLQAGNYSSHVGFSKQFNNRHARVWILRDGVEVESTIADLHRNDVIIVNAGEVFALEGKIIKGTGLVSQFDLRKNIKLIPKQVGDKVFPLTQLTSGHLHIRPI